MNNVDPGQSARIDIVANAIKNTFVKINTTEGCPIFCYLYTCMYICHLVTPVVVLICIYLMILFLYKLREITKLNWKVAFLLMIITIMIRWYLGEKYIEFDICCIIKSIIFCISPRIFVLRLFKGVYRNVIMLHTRQTITKWEDQFGLNQDRNIINIMDTTDKITIIPPMNRDEVTFFRINPTDTQNM